MVRLTRRQALAAAAALAVPGRAAPGRKLDAVAVTRGPKHHFFGYYDKCPWDKTGRYLLAMEVGFCDRQPARGEPLTVGMVDLTDDNKYVSLDTTTAWCWQQGTMLQWLGSAPDREVIYNSVADGKYVSVVRDVKSGKTRTLPRPVYAVSADGKQAVTLDFARLHRLRPGYGYCALDETHAADPAPADLGVWHMNLATGATELAVSVAKLAANKPDARFAGAQHWVNHLQFNPGGTRFVFLHRWRVGDKPWHTRLYTAKPDGSDLRLHHSDGMVSHFDWRDDRTLLMWATVPGEKRARFITLDTDTNAAAVVGEGALDRDGHCSYSPDRKWVLNDTYPDTARLQTLMLFDPKTSRRTDLNTFHSPPVFAGPWRCDLHPRWNRDGTTVCFDGSHGPQRQVYVVDVRDVVGG